MIELRALSLRHDGSALAALLAQSGLRLADGVDEWLGAWEDDALLGCAGRQKNVIVCAAVQEKWRGTGLLARLVTELLTTIRQLGYEGAFVFTKPDAAARFAALGFCLTAQTPEAALLYSRSDGVRRWAATLTPPRGGRVVRQAGQDSQDGAPRYQTGCVVLNANPFTLGHRYLIEQAAAQCGGLYALVVEREVGAFSFADRLRLVREGTADLANVAVCPGGMFCISQATFPSYFLKRADDAARVHAALDAAVFAEAIAPALHIDARFVGSEPLDPMTAQYNEAILRVLPEHGVAAVVVERRTVDGAPISASRVRALLQAGRLDALAPLVPQTTLTYLTKLCAAELAKGGGV